MDWLIPYLIICPMVGLAGFVDAIAGGGGLISLPAYMIAGLPPHVAVGTNKFSAFCGTVVATWRYARQGLFNIKDSIAAIIAALIGSTIGAKIALMIPSSTFEIILLIVIPITAVIVLCRKEIRTDKAPFAPGKTSLIASVIAFVIGVYDGIYGPGTGTFMLLLLVYGARMSLNESAGVTKAINLSTNAAALVIFLMNDVVLFPLAIVAGVFGIVGNYLGASMFLSNGAKIVRPIIIVVMAILFGKIIWPYVF